MPRKTCNGEPASARGRLRIAAAVGGCVLAGAALAVDNPSAHSNANTRPPAARPLVVSRSHRAEMWYAARFGVEEMHVRTVSSGASVEFRYRVLDVDKAAVLTDRNATPYLIDEETGTRLEVPVMEKIGALRQTATPQAGHDYWMMFANHNKLVSSGRRVDIHCGAFHIRGLIVE